ncbi:DNA-binding transcriptional LysR family regulator [Bradyrhizobium sp. i1.7.7]
MARFDTNRSAEMEVFVRVVELGGFTQAARNLRLTPSGVSKLISRLETRLGSRLINRTTRKLTLTEEGQAFYQRTVRILGEMEEAEREAASGAAPRGHLTVNCNIPFGMLHVLPLIPRFLERHPEITLDLVLTDTLIDLMQERADIAIRVGPLKASRLVARKLGTSRMVVVGTPNYLARFGTPKTPADLTQHRGIGWTFPRIRGGWPFRRGDHTEEAMPPPAARASDGEIARRLALGRRRPRPPRPLPHRPRHRIGPSRSGLAELQSRRPRRHPRRLCRPHRAPARARARVHRFSRRACAGERPRAEARGGREVEGGLGTSKSRR